jgi:hypothetical protein
MLSLFAFATLAACGGSSSDDGAQEPAPAPAGDDAPPDVPPAPTAPSLGFAPSNLDQATADGLLGAGGAVAINASCKFDTKTGTNDCLSASGVKFFAMTQNDAAKSKVAVFAMKSLSIAKSVTVTVTGDVPAIFFVTGAVTIDGYLLVQPGSAGGASSPGAAASKGAGPGGGGAMVKASHQGAGGGSYCGTGGNSGGATYGNPEIRPLVGGSTGGTGGPNGGGTGFFAGAGGGAIQITSGVSITIDGVVGAGGSGGAGTAAGGGSGGSILLEAPSITVDGYVAAGGGGGGSDTGKPGGNGDIAGSPNISGGGGVQPGGNGGGGLLVSGGSATYTPMPPDQSYDDTSGGGGGGAGRVRFVTKTGAATLRDDGVVSPQPFTLCFTQAKLSTK